MMKRNCTVPDCGDSVHCRDLCVRHYRRLMRHGDPLAGRQINRNPRLPLDASVEDRFWIKVDRRGPDECWTWLGGCTGGGHGVYRGAEVKERFGTHLAHRIAWLLDGRDLHPPLVLDHLCRNRPCVNPQHLEEVTAAENVRRGANTLKTHCPRGHEYTPDNTYTQASGGRACRACGREATKRYLARKAAATT